MDAMQWTLEAALTVLLAATLFQALRLERALGVVKRDRTELEALVRSFNDSTRQAESGIVRLRDAADGAGRHITRQIEAAAELKNELGHLVSRGETLSDRLDAQLRSTRDLVSPRLGDLVGRSGAESRSQERPLPDPNGIDTGLPRVRSQAERDLLRALRVAR